MTTRLFEEPVETVEPSAQAKVPLATRLPYCAVASLVAIVPAVAATYSGFQVMRLFRSMTDAESARAVRILAHLSVSNTPLIIALVVAALLAFALAIALATDSQRRVASVGWPFSIVVPILGATPGLLLWWAETIVIDILSGKLVGAPVQTTAETISNLLFWAIASGLVVPCVVFVGAVVSLCIPVRSRMNAFSVPRAFVWGAVGMIFLIFAGAYLVLI